MGECCPRFERVEFEGALARALGPFRGNNKWLSRIRVRRVAHAVLWGDGLRFRVRDGRLLSSRAQHTLTRSRAPWVDAPAARSSRCVRLPCLGSQGAAANQDISLASDTRASSGGVDSRQRARTRTHGWTRSHIHKSPHAKAMPKFLFRQSGSSWVASARATRERCGLMMMSCLFSQHTTDNKHRYR